MSVGFIEINANFDGFQLLVGVFDKLNEIFTARIYFLKLVNKFRIFAKDTGGNKFNFIFRRKFLTKRFKFSIFVIKRDF